MKTNANISTLGYSRNSPYRTSPYLDIHSPAGEITMENTDIDLLGIDNVGNMQLMKAGNKNPYKFPGDVIREIPMQKGGYTRQDIVNYIFNDDPEDEATYNAPVNSLEVQQAPVLRNEDLDQREAYYKQMQEEMDNQTMFNMLTADEYVPRRNRPDFGDQKAMAQGIDPNVQAATDELTQKFPGLRITSGIRNWGDPDAHPKGRAIDVAGTDLDKAFEYYKSTIVPKYGFNPALNPNHGTGKHIHVGYYQQGGWIPNAGNKGMLGEQNIEDALREAMKYKFKKNGNFKALIPLEDWNDDVMNYIDKFKMVNRKKQQFVKVRGKIPKDYNKPPDNTTTSEDEILQQGGRVPIYTSNPDDERIIRYQDSLVRNQKSRQQEIYNENHWTALVNRLGLKGAAAKQKIEEYNFTEKEKMAKVKGAITMTKSVLNEQQKAIKQANEVRDDAKEKAQGYGMFQRLDEVQKDYNTAKSAYQNYIVGKENVPVGYKNYDFTVDRNNMTNKESDPYGLARWIDYRDEKSYVPEYAKPVQPYIYKQGAQEQYAKSTPTNSGFTGTKTPYGKRLLEIPKGEKEADYQVKTYYNPVSQNTDWTYVKKAAPKRRTSSAQLIPDEMEDMNLSVQGRTSPNVDVNKEIKTNYSYSYRTPEGNQSTRYFPDLTSWQDFIKDKTYITQRVSGDKKEAQATGYYKKGGKYRKLR